MFQIEINYGNGWTRLADTYPTREEANWTGAIKAARASCAMWLNCDYRIIDLKNERN